MALWMWVALGSALGGVGRYAVAKIWPAVPGGWPIATIVVNVVGGFTTYSAFALVAS